MTEEIIKEIVVTTIKEANQGNTNAIYMMVIILLIVAIVVIAKFVIDFVKGNDRKKEQQTYSVNIEKVLENHRDEMLRLVDSMPDWLSKQLHPDVIKITEAFPMINENIAKLSNINDNINKIVPIITKQDDEGVYLCYHRASLTKRLIESNEQMINTNIQTITALNKIYDKIDKLK